jgi:3',5'-cyclic AMP phosphodiesterase CpdA
MLIDHLPFYPCMGNHDTNENFNPFAQEKQQDRLTLYDNLLVFPRFAASGRPPSRPDADASVSPGLFYRFRFGSQIEFVCLDSSKEKEVTDERLFEFPKHAAWLSDALRAPLGTLGWRIPFSHHSPYCKGPTHDDDETNLRHHVMALCEQHGGRVFFGARAQLPVHR